MKKICSQQNWIWFPPWLVWCLSVEPRAMFYQHRMFYSNNFPVSQPHRLYNLCWPCLTNLMLYIGKISSFYRIPLLPKNMEQFWRNKKIMLRKSLTIGYLGRRSGISPAQAWSGSSFGWISFFGKLSIPLAFPPLTHPPLACLCPLTLPLPFSCSPHSPSLCFP